MNEKSKLKLAPFILKRFEENLEGGLLFLYNVNTNDLWTGNLSSFYLIKLINGKRTVIEIYEELFPMFQEYNIDETKKSFDNLLNNLINKNFLEIVKNG